MRRPAAILLALLVALVCAPVAAAVVSPGAPSVERTARPTPTRNPAPSPTSAPAGTTPAAGTAPVAAADDDDEGGGTPGGDGNWMAANGLRSPACAGSRAPSCEASGTRSISAAPGHYQFHSWTEGGTLGMPTWNGIVSSVLGFLWSLIVQVTVAVFSLLEWAMSFNLTQVGDGALSRVHLLNASWGMPIAAVMLALGAIWVGLQAFSAGKIAGALSSVATGFLVMGVAVAVVSSPANTIGRLTDLTADLGRQGAAAPLAIAMPNADLEDGLSQTWQIVVERPFSLLEFGDTDWGSNPDKLNPDLVAAARKIASHQGTGVQARVRAAETNAAIFAVWPSNSNERNSRKADKCGGEACLLNVICGGEEDLKDCKGPMARYARARLDGGVMSRVQEVPIIGLGMLSVWLVLGAIAVGLLWSFVSIIKNVIVLAYLWVLVLTFKPETRRKATDVLLRLIGSAVSLVVFGIAAGVAITLFVLVQSLGLPWMAQWVLSIIAVIGLWFERKQITGLMSALLSHQEQNVAGGGFTGRLASSYATGIGLGALRGGPGARRGPLAAGGAGGSGGGLPVDLPNAPGSSSGSGGAGSGRGSSSGGGPSRMATAGAAVAAGAVAGPIGSAAAAALLQRRAIASGAKTGAGRVAGGAAAIAAPAVSAAGSLASTAGALGSAAERWNGQVPDGVLAPADQATSLLAGQQAHRVRRGEEAAAALPAAGQELITATAAYGDAVATFVAANPDDPMREQYAADVDAAGQAQTAATEHSDRLQTLVNAGEDAQGWDPTDASSPAAARASAWLDTQATTPEGQRAYGQLAAMHGVSPGQWRVMPAERKAELHGQIDNALALRTPAAESRPSALHALGQVASAQRWGGR